MKNKNKLLEAISPHAQYWDCYNDCSLEYNHTGKILKEFEKFSTSFLVFVVENCHYQGNGWWNRNYKDEALTAKELYKIWENELQ